MASRRLETEPSGESILWVGRIHWPVVVWIWTVADLLWLLGCMVGQALNLVVVTLCIPRQ